MWTKQDRELKYGITTYSKPCTIRHKGITNEQIK